MKLLRTIRLDASNRAAEIVFRQRALAPQEHVLRLKPQNLITGLHIPHMGPVI